MNLLNDDWDPHILCLADDLTGALEVGSKFAACRLSSLVCSDLCVQIAAAAGTQALVIDAQTRHLEPAQAEATVCRLAREGFRTGLRCVYKKTDSTLRGNIAAELRGLMSSYPGMPLLYAPAYPSLGRTVRNGCLYVEGVPVNQSSFGRDRLNPAREAHIPTLLQPLPVISIRTGELAGMRPGTVYVFDGVTEDEVREVAQIITRSDQLVLAAGPAALAQNLAELARLPRCRPEPTPVIASCLVINGSRHEQSLLQIRAAVEAGWLQGAPGEVPALISRCGWVLMELPAPPSSSPTRFASRMGEVAMELLSRIDLDAVVIFGGDTSRGIVDALGRPPLYPVAEVLPGVPVAKILAADLAGRAPGRNRDLYLITKAGGFGPPDVLARIRECTGSSW